MFNSKLHMRCESSGFTIIDNILNSVLKNQAQNQKINSENGIFKSAPRLFVESTEHMNDFSLKNTNISKIETQTKRKSDDMGYKNFRELYLTSIKRDDYSLSYDSSTTCNIGKFTQYSSNNYENKKSTEKNEILKQKIKRVLIIRPNKITPSNGFDHEITDEKQSPTHSHLKQKRIKKKKRVSFSGKATLFSYSYAKKSENDEYNLLAQSILKKLDAVLDEESRERNIQAKIAHIKIPSESIPKNDQKIVEEMPLDKKLENQLRDSPSVLNKNLALENFMILDEEPNDEPVKEDTIFSRHLNEKKSDDNQEILTPKISNNDINNNQITDVTNNNEHITKSNEENINLTEKDFKMETTFQEEKDEEKIFTNKPMRFFVIERLGNLVEVDNKMNEPRKNPQEEKINLAFDKIEKLLRQNGKLNRQKSRLSNAFSTYINNII